MKKLLSIVLCLLMLVSVVSLAGCGDKKSDTSSNGDKTATDLKFGMGIESVISNVTNAEGNDGKAEIDHTVAAVLVDGDGKIVKCVIDVMAPTAEYTADGKAVAATEFKTKYELGDKYGMKQAGAAKEWYEQVDAFVKVDEVKALVAEGGKGNPDVVNAGCTIAVADFVLALEKAIKNAKASDATSDNSLKLGIVSKQSVANNASADKNGVNEIATSFTAVVLDKDSKVVAMVTDSAEVSVEFNTKGVCTNADNAISTKLELGDKYGMKQAGAAKEWYEQAEAFNNACKGLNADSIAKLAVENGYGNEDLQSAGCTINIADMVKSAVKAAK